MAWYSITDSSILKKQPQTPTVSFSVRFLGLEINRKHLPMHSDGNLAKLSKITPVWFKNSP